MGYTVFINLIDRRLNLNMNLYLTRIVHYKLVFREAMSKQVARFRAARRSERDAPFTLFPNTHGNTLLRWRNTAHQNTPLSVTTQTQLTPNYAERSGPGFPCIGGQPDA